METGIVVLAGPPCSGKSSVRRALAEAPAHRGSTSIEVDTLFSILFPRSDRARADRLLAYDAAHALARLLVGRGRCVVLECTYARRAQRASLLDALAGLPATPVWVVELFISSDEAVARFQRRDQATDLDEVAVRERAEAFPYSDQAFRVASSGGPAGQARQVMEWLGGRPRPVDLISWVAAGRGWD